MTFSTRITAPVYTLFGIACLSLSTGCGAVNSASSAGEDNSTSGIAAAFVGGTVSNSSNTGKLSQQLPNFRQKSVLDFLKVEDAYASTACPTYASNGTGCSASGSSLTLTYSDCSFGGSTASWTGSQVLTLSSGTPACGTWITGPGFSGNLTRTFVGTIAGGNATTRTSAAGTVVQFDTSAGLTNYTGTPVAGGGVVVLFGGGQRTQIDITGVNLVSTGHFNHTLSTPNALAINDTATGKVVTGNVQLLHNLEKVTGTSTFNNVTYTPDCCAPTSGSISTAFTAGTNGNTHSKFVGQTESLTFTGCGTATYTDVTGTTSSVAINHCL